MTGYDYPDHRSLHRTDVYETIDRLGGLKGVLTGDPDDARAAAYAALETGLALQPDGSYRVTPEALETARRLLREGGWIEQPDGIFTPPPRRPLPWQRGR